MDKEEKEKLIRKFKRQVVSTIYSFILGGIIALIFFLIVFRMGGR